MVKKNIENNKPSKHAQSETPLSGDSSVQSASSPHSREFDAYKPYRDDIQERVWNSGLIVLDTNVLLHLYRVDEKLRTALFSIIEDKKISARLWFPYQATKEFFAGRIGVITGQLRALENLSKRVSESTQSLLDTKDSPRFLIDRDKFKSILQENENKTIAFLNSAKNSYPATISKDLILDRVVPVLEKCTGSAPSEAASTSMLVEGMRRTKEKIPPGFVDNKPVNGDYFVWEQCLEKCATEKRDLLLVTDDKKEDWWYRIQGYTIGPRLELRNEFYTRVPGSDFVLASFDTFVERISNYMLGRLSETAIDDARQFSLFHHQIKYHADEDEDQDEPDYDERRDISVAKYRETAPTKDRDAVKSVDAMVSWFLERYDDPANGVPYDGREGGYQYIAGGPYNAEEELREAFDNGTKRMERMITEATRQIENDGFEWVKRGQY